jgi:hypothetical protein
MARSSGLSRFGRAAWVPGIAALLCACTSLKVVDDTANSVTIRYDGAISTLDDATAAANQACAAHGKVAKLRENDVRAALERFARFNCVSS